MSPDTSQKGSGKLADVLQEENRDSAALDIPFAVLKDLLKD
jgi:uncharacterized metal-binding protein YceD (DUF177 family)